MEYVVEIGGAGVGILLWWGLGWVEGVDAGGREGSEPKVFVVLLLWWCC